MARNLRIQTLINMLSPEENSKLIEVLSSLNDESMDANQNFNQIRNSITEVQDSIPAEVDLSGLATDAELEALADSFVNHKDRHTSGGADAFTSTDFLQALIKRVRTVTADLTFATVNDGEFLQRSGTTIISSVSAGGGLSQAQVLARVSVRC